MKPRLIVIFSLSPSFGRNWCMSAVMPSPSIYHLFGWYMDVGQGIVKGQNPPAPDHAGRIGKLLFRKIRRPQKPVDVAKAETVRASAGLGGGRLGARCSGALGYWSSGGLSLGVSERPRRLSP